MPRRKKEHHRNRKLDLETEIETDQKRNEMKSSGVQFCFLASSSQLHAPPQVPKHADNIGTHCNISIVVFHVERPRDTQCHIHIFVLIRRRRRRRTIAALGRHRYGGLCLWWRRACPGVRRLFTNGRFSSLGLIDRFTE